MIGTGKQHSKWICWLTCTFLLLTGMVVSAVAGPVQVWVQPSGDTFAKAYVITGESRTYFGRVEGEAAATNINGNSATALRLLSQQSAIPDISPMIRFSLQPAHNGLNLRYGMPAIPAIAHPPRSTCKLSLQPATTSTGKRIQPLTEACATPIGRKM